MGGQMAGWFGASINGLTWAYLRKSPQINLLLLRKSKMLKKTKFAVIPFQVQPSDSVLSM